MRGESYLFTSAIYPQSLSAIKNLCFFHKKKETKKRAIRRVEVFIV